MTRKNSLLHVLTLVGLVLLCLIGPAMTAPVAAQAEDFTIIVLPDTQYYSQNQSEHFPAQTQWIVDNKDALNIVYVAHEGDVVQTAGNIPEWEYADAAMSYLEDPVTTGLPDGIPYGILPGNHDQDPNGNRDGTANYNNYFGVDRFSGREYYSGHHGVDNDNNYALFTVDGMDFIVINLEYNLASEVITWADTLLSNDYSDRRAIVVSHSILNTDGSFTTDGQNIYNELRDNPNLFLMLCGHMHGEARRTETYNGNTIEILLADYQNVGASHGDGWLRIMEFSPANNEITVTTYSPTLDDYGEDTTMSTDTTSAPFTLAYDMGEPGPTITVTGVPLSAFSSEPGTPSAEQSYTVVGSLLTENVTITAPADFEISMTSGSGFTSSLTLTQSGGTVTATPIYVRFNRATEGTSSGDIAHTSAGATTRNVAVSGEATVPVEGWIAYNDCVYESGEDGYLGANVTTFGVGDGFTGDTSGELLDQATGDPTGVTASLTESGGVNWQSGTQYGGADTAEGTDANDTFGDITDMIGVIQYGDEGWYVDLTFTGLDPAKQYTFATSASRNNSTYTERYTQYTLSGVDGATNASTAGVNEISNLSVWFNTGDNHDEGYVARWTGIQPGADGSFTVRAEAHPDADDNKAYTFDVFMLQEESTDPTITVTGVPLSAFSSEPGTPSAEQSYTVVGSLLTENVTISAPADFEISTTSGSGFGSSLTLTQSGGSVAPTTVYVRFNRATAGTSSGNITHTSAGATTQNVAVSGTAAITPTTVVFQDDLNGYTGTRDTYIWDDEPGDSHGSQTTIVQDINTSDERRSLLLFDLSSIPVGATIISSELQFYVSAEGQGFNMHRMLVSWDETVTYDSIGGRLFAADGIDAESSTNANWPGDDGYTGFITVSIPTSTIQDWVDGTLVNNGWLMIATDAGGDGQQLRSREHGTQEHRPRLTVEYLPPSTEPTITISGSLSAFSSQPGVPSAEQSYTVSGVNLTEDIVITAPADFEISTTSGGPFGSSLTLPQSGGSVAVTPIYVRFNRDTVGISSGDIAHTSAGATTRNVAVSGEATVPVEGWIAYNDCVYESGEDGYLGANVTTFGVGDGFTGDTSGELLDQATGNPTGVTASLTQSGGVTWQSGDTYGGADTAAGTDANDTFGGLTDMIGVLQYGDEGWYVDLTFTGLDPAKQYTFATSASRNNSSYTERYTQYTLSGVDGATNASTAGVNEISNLSAWFNTGDNHDEGYVARWTGIQPGADGSFTVRAEAYAERRAYAFDVFMLQEEEEEIPTSSLSPSSMLADTPYAEQVFTLTLTNNGVATDTFDLTYVATDTSSLPPGPSAQYEWVVITPTATVTVPAGMSATLRVTVEIPSLEVKWVTHTLTITATSRNHPAQVLTSTLTTFTGGHWDAVDGRWEGCRFDIGNTGQVIFDDTPISLEV